MCNSAIKKPIRRVFVTQDNGQHNLFPALQHGELTVFTRHDMPVLYDEINRYDGWLDRLANWVSDFNPDTDSMLLLGDPVVIAATSAILGTFCDQFTVLKWDRQEKVYIPVRLVINPEETKEGGEPSEE